MAPRPGPSPEAAQRGRRTQKSSFANEAERRAHFQEMSAKGLAARLARRDQRDLAIAKIREALELLGAL